MVVATMEAPSQGLQTVMKWKTVVAIFVVVVVYLVAGGLVFRALEQPFESRQKNTIALEKADFLREHVCVTQLELETLIQVGLMKITVFFRHQCEQYGSSLIICIGDVNRN